MRGYLFLDKIELGVLLRASMVMLNGYLDIVGSAEILELAQRLYSKEEVEQMCYDIIDAHEGSTEEVKNIKAHLIMMQLGGSMPDLKENN